MSILLILSICLLLIFLYLCHVNNAMTRLPPEVANMLPAEHRWTQSLIRETFKRVSENPIDATSSLPPAPDRRYVVVGGSGLVGGNIALQLLARGHKPEAIRIIDFRRSTREDMQHGPVTKVEFIQTDITDEDSVQESFSIPWASKVATHPLTVFHTAAAIRPWERFARYLPRNARVNILGTQNVLAAAKSVGADIFISTSSGSITIKPTKYWIWPWEKYPRDYVQVFKDPEDEQLIRPHGQYFSNYAETKAQSELIVLNADKTPISSSRTAGPRKLLRTGTIRPCGAVYGNKYDMLFGSFVLRGHIETWLQHKSQPVVSATNVALAHLQYEAALIKSPETTSGKSFNVADPNPQIHFDDIYVLLPTLIPEYKITYVPAVMMLLIAHAIEAYGLLVNVFPVLQKVGLKEPSGLIGMLQPATLPANTNFQFFSDKPARRKLEDGGIEYVGVGTSLENMCDQVYKHLNELKRDTENGTAVKMVVRA